MDTLTDWVYEGPIIFPQFGIFYSTNRSLAVASSGGVLNSNASDFDVKNDNIGVKVNNICVCFDHGHCHQEYSRVFNSDGYVYMNGDVGKLPSGAVYSSTPESSVGGTTSDYNMVNGGMAVSTGEMVNEAGGGGGGGYIGSTLEGISPSVPAQSDHSTIPLDQLKQMLSSQLEYYFSRENLANDAYLLSQMDNDQYVPIWTVANFNQVKKLTKDINLITEVLRESPNVQVDEEGIKVRPNHKRCIVILREIPDNTPIEDVKNLFSGENCPRLISCEFAHNNSWYVTFETDDDAQRAYRFLREEVREFQGKPIMARIKAKPMHRMPLAPVPGVKNGYRTTPPQAAAYDPSTVYPPNPQRFVFANGTPAPQYTNQMHLYQYYTPNMLQAWPATTTGPFYDIGSVFTVNGLSPQSSFKQPTSRYAPRGRNKQRNINTPNDVTNPARTQHIPPPGSPQARSQGNRVAVSATVVQQQQDTDVSSTSVAANGSNSNSGSVNRSENEDVSSLTYRPSNPAAQSSNKDVPPPRHRPRRRRDDELPPSPLPTAPTREHLNTRGSHFDLEAAAFPPLPGLEVDSQIPKPLVIPTSEVHIQQSEVSSQWGENRLADVVKGTVKSKTFVNKEKETNVNSSIEPINNTIRTEPPSMPTVSISTNQNVSSGSGIQLTTTALSTPTSSSLHSNVNVTTTGTTVYTSKDASTSSGHSFPNTSSIVSLTPPSSPDKLVPVPVSKCTMADKSTKTDESLLNGELIDHIPCPTTTNAATMTTIVTMETSSQPVQSLTTTTSAAPFRSISPPLPIESGSSNQPPRMSYAQVAQHHKERLTRERYNSTGEQQQQQTTHTNPQPQQSKDNKSSTASTTRVPDTREHREPRGHTRRTKSRANQANRQKPQSTISPSGSNSPKHAASPIQSCSPHNPEGSIDSSDVTQQTQQQQQQQQQPQQQRDNRYGGRTGSNRSSFERPQSGPGRRRSGLEQRTQFREYLGQRSPK